MPHVDINNPQMGHRPDWDEERGGGDVVKYGDEPSGPGRPPGGAPQYPGLDELGLGALFEGTTFEDSWQKYFDEYDPRKEELLRKQAGIDIGQLGEAWDLKQTQLGNVWDLRQTQLGDVWQQQLGGLGESFRLQTGGLGQQWQSTQAGMGAQARQGFGQVNQMGQQMAQRGRGLTFGGEKQRIGKQSVMEDYERQFGSAQGAYQQAMAGATTGYKQGIGKGELGYKQALATGQLGYEQALASGGLAFTQGQTDIQQGLETDVFGAQSAWEQRQRDWAFSLLAGDIYEGNT